MWEFFFPGVDKPLLIIPGEDMPLDKEDSDEMKVGGALSTYLIFVFSPDAIF